MTRRRSPWPLAAALLLADGRLASAQVPPPLPPPPPSAAPSAPANFPPPPVKGGPAGVAAVVNGTPISRAQVQHVALTLAGKQALQQVLADALVQQEAKKEGVTVAPAELNARVAQLRQQLATQYPGGFDAALKSQGVSLADFKGTLRVRILAEKLVGRTQKPTHRAHIHYVVVLTATPPGGVPPGGAAPHTDAEAQAIIAKAQADLKSGTSFEDVVRKYSEDPGKNTGGDIGVIGPESVGQLDPTFVQAALALKPGEVTATPVHSAQFGYFLLRAVSTSESATGAEKALYATAEQQDLRKQVQAYFLTLVKNAKITNYFTP